MRVKCEDYLSLYIYFFLYLNQYLLSIFINLTNLSSAYDFSIYLKSTYKKIPL